MRIVAGEFKGRPLHAPPGREVRPTSDRVREAVFSILSSVEGLRVLDLFAGSGAMAFEALSRGASSAVLIDTSAAAIAAISRNMSALGVDVEVRKMSATAFLERASASARQYDLVFVDPPYRQASVVAPMLSAALPAVLAPRARVVAESDRRAPLELDLPLLTERRYGDTLITIHDTR